MPLLSPGLCYPEALECPAAPRSKRRASRFWVRRRAMRVLNEIFAFSSYFELGCPSEGLPPEFVRRPFFHPRVRRAADRLIGGVLAFCRLDPAMEFSGGRASLK